MAPRGEKSELKLSGLGAIRSKWGSIRMMVDEGMAKCSGVRAGLSVHTNTHPCRHTLGGRGSSDGPRGASLNHERGLSISARPKRASGSDDSDVPIGITPKCCVQGRS